ncbi:MAG: MarR family winged helix-turn-helix transcriptional regulator [Flavobacteriales bacterium]|nr:MarR family transcriptional regulator [Flavobacteriales bacterium]HRE97826.1 MarR family transcriptional regulator [Flavobacteriales bacterium]HRJ36195.1 MarR family transcriptional regulator [Flavobacteriales bacterium]HRJ37667.1 MarR family transcriptional regulator [Flavobacteriales bacterium]
MKPEETIDFHIRWAWHGISRLYNGQAEKVNLTLSTGSVLLNIDQRSGTPSTKLGPKMGMEPRSLTRTLKSMEEEGLIMRKNDKNDGRMVRIHLTEMGKKKREISKQAVIRLNEYLQERIPAGKLKTFFEVIDQINHVLEEETPDHLFGKK